MGTKFLQTLNSAALSGLTQSHLVLNKEEVY